MTMAELFDCLDEDQKLDVVEVYLDILFPVRDEDDDSP